MSDKVEAISQSKEIAQAIKQDQLRKQEEKQAGEAAKPGASAGRKEGVEEKGAKAGKARKEAGQKKEPAAPSKKVVLERVYTVPLIKAYAKTRSHRSRVAVSLLRQFVARHAKASGRVSISGEVNSFVLARGSRKPPKKVKVMVRKDEEGRVFVGFPKA